MGLPVRLIDILARQTVAENMQCPECAGSGEDRAPDVTTGDDTVICEFCLGSGYNQLGLILQGILKPPVEGYGPVELKEALVAHLKSLEQTETSGESLNEEVNLKRMALLLAYERELNELVPDSASKNNRQVS